VLSHPPKQTARALAPGGILLPNSVGNTGGLLAGMPRMARAALMGKGSRDVRFVPCVPNRDNLEALAALLESDVKVVIDTVYPLAEAGKAVAHMFGHRARGKIVIAV
jgi:NADPH:quinone reductase-like Zn-dependent oxidoreductase